MWKSNSQFVHKPLGEAERVDHQTRHLMKEKLTRTNFGMGAATVGYYTTTKTQHSPMKGDYFTKTQRNVKKDAN